LRSLAALAGSATLALFAATGFAYALDDPKTWPADILDWRQSPVDLSFLNANDRPAGKRGFVKVVGDRLEFEDGSAARFWGTNLTAYALFDTSSAGIKQQARRLSQLGFNLVRLHHHDSVWVAPNVFGDQNIPSTQRLDPAMLEKLDAWISALKGEGIYVWLDLHVGRQLRGGDDISAFDEIRKGQPTADLRGYNYVNPSIQAAMKRFNEAYVNRVNRYTGVAYKDEPAIMDMLVTNENDLTHHFGNALLPDKNVAWHNAIYMREASEFAAAKGLSNQATWRSWEHGPPKIFLNDLEHRFQAEMVRHLRAQGVKVPIATTNQWGGNPISSLPALTAGSVIDGHAYGGLGELEKNPLQARDLRALACGGSGRGQALHRDRVERRCVSRARSSRGTAVHGRFGGPPGLGRRDAIRLRASAPRRRARSVAVARVQRSVHDCDAPRCRASLQARRRPAGNDDLRVRPHPGHAVQQGALAAQRRRAAHGRREGQAGDRPPDHAGAAVAFGERDPGRRDRDVGPRSTCHRPIRHARRLRPAG
jgi:hypothetical protein